MRHDPYAALRVKDYRLFILARFFLTFSVQIQAVTVGWQIYQITNDPFSLGMIGLAEAVPAIGIALFGGHLADTLNRKVIIISCALVLMLCSTGLYTISLTKGDDVSLISITGIYAIIFLSGIARGIMGPAIFAFWPQLIDNKEIYTNAVTWNSTVWQISSTAGPAVGGLLIAPAGIANTYLIDAGLLFLSLLLFFNITSRPLPQGKFSTDFWINITEGIRFVFSNQLILGAITLDLLAVLFGGAVALLPVFAKDILHAGALEFGLLKAAMGVGSVATAVMLAYRPIRKKAGIKMLWAVAGFAIAMILFGLSRWFWVSFGILFVAGICDGLSVVIRGTLMQLYTPDHMKGRVSAVNNIFIGSSNEIGAFESGFMAKLMGVIPSVIFGGALSLLAVMITAWKAEKLRKLEM